MPILVEHFLERFAAHSTRPQTVLAVAGGGAGGPMTGSFVSPSPREGYRVDPDAMDALVEYPWPGKRP